MRLARSLIAILILTLPSLAWGQSAVLQGGTFTAGQIPQYSSSGQSQPIVQAGGNAGGGAVGVNPGEIGVTARGTGTAPYAAQGHGPNGEVFAIFDAPTTNATGYHYMGFSPNAQGGGLISYGSGGTATALPLQFIVNGVTYQFPFSIGGVVGPATSVVNDAACWNNTAGTLLKDCGAFVTVGGANVWTGSNNFTSTFQIASVTQAFPASGNLVGTSDTQTLTNKSIAASQINSGTLPTTVMPAFTGDVTSSAGTAINAIAPNAVTNAKLATATVNTVKGAATSTTVTDLAVPSCSAAASALQWLTGTGFQCGTLGATTAGWGVALSGGGVFSIATAQPPYGFDVPINLGLTASVNASALTINVTGANGSAPSATNPVSVPFRSTTLATGTPVWTAITSALSIIVPSAATLGTSNSVPFRVWIFLAYNSGTPELGVAVCSISTQVYPCSAWESTRKTTISIDGFSTSSGVLYATTGVSNDAVRIIGYADYSAGLATAGAWASVPTTLQVLGPGSKKPGEMIQTIYFTNSTDATAATTAFAATSSTVSITPTAAMNLIRINSTGYGNSTGGTSDCLYEIHRGASTAIGTRARIGDTGSATSTVGATAALSALDAPGVATATSYTVYLATSTSTQTCHYSNGLQTVIQADEIQGGLDEPANDNINPGVYSLTG